MASPPLVSTTRSVSWRDVLQPEAGVTDTPRPTVTPLPPGFVVVVVGRVVVGVVLLEELEDDEVDDPLGEGDGRVLLVVRFSVEGGMLSLLDGVGRLLVVGVDAEESFFVNWVTRSAPPPRTAKATTTMAMILAGLPPRLPP